MLAGYPCYKFPWAYKGCLLFQNLSLYLFNVGRLPLLRIPVGICNGCLLFQNLSLFLFNVGTLPLLQIPVSM
jgi:hypothetical protein